MAAIRFGGVWLRFFKDDGKEHIGADSPKEASLEFLFAEIDRLPSSPKCNFIGLINDECQTIQFTRLGRDQWLLDVPVLKGGSYSYSLQNDDLTTAKVKEIVKKFYSAGDWKSLCNLRRPN